LLARQLLRAVTSIGAQLEEAGAPDSRRDMAHKYSIGLREAREARFWARLLATDSACAATITPIVDELGEFVAMLTTAVKKLRRKENKSEVKSTKSEVGEQ
jgi:four helix bundle protein